MQNHEIKISAILPNYNSAAFLPRAVQSLLAQTEPFDEIIIVDDGSTDESIEIIHQLIQAHPVIRLLRHEKNQGVNPALNTGIKQAMGDYIILCAADDVYSHKMVELAKKVIRKHPAVGLVCGDAMVRRYDLNAPFYRPLPYPPNTLISPDEFKKLARKTFACFNSGGSMFINRQLVLSVGMTLPPLRWHGDWLLYFVCAFKQGFYYVDEVFIHIDIRKAGYCENGRQNIQVQNQVMLATVRAIDREYPELWEDFKAAALMPHYALRYIRLFWSDSVGRRFLSMRLVWKMFINNRLITRLGRLFPYKVILRTRKLLKA